MTRIITSTAGLPLLPPPLVHYPLSQDLESLFELAFISGNISVCRGCRHKYTKLISYSVNVTSLTNGDPSQEATMLLPIKHMYSFWFMRTEVLPNAAIFLLSYL